MIRQYIDIPPVWLIGALTIAWFQSTYVTLGLSLDWPIVQFVGGLSVGGGFLLIFLAVIEMWKHKTTIMPHQTANTLVTQGIFKRSRNPIYLGDTFILLGFILTWDAVLSLPLVPAFVWIIERRYIEPEEDRLRRKFRLEFARYLQQTRRWM